MVNLENLLNIENLLNFTNDIFQKKEVRALLQEVSEVAQYLWERGWAERNAGNISVRVTGHFTEKELDRLGVYPFLPLPKGYPDLGRQLFLVSATGARMRDTAKNPAANVCFVFVNEPGTAYHIISQPGEENVMKPTSELATHLAIQQMLLQKKAPESVVLHTHVLELIALTQLPQFKSEEAVNNLLWGMHPETILFVPDGVGFIPYTLPGSEKIAQATLKGLENHRVILWEKHGCMAVSNSLAEAFDTIDILAKSAKIYFLSKSTGIEPEGLSNDQLREIGDSFPVKVE
jgi:rhamnulose-1-phosphate aldolase